MLANDGDSTVAYISVPTYVVPPPSVTSLFGNRLRELRVERGRTQLQFAIDSDLDRVTICDLENGHSNVRLVTLDKLAKALGISLSDLLNGL